MSRLRFCLKKEGIITPPSGLGTRLQLFSLIICLVTTFHGKLNGDYSFRFKIPNCTAFGGEGKVHEGERNLHGCRTRYFGPLMVLLFFFKDSH